MLLLKPVLFLTLFCLVFATECHVCSYTITAAMQQGGPETVKDGDAACQDNPTSDSTILCDGECFVSSPTLLTIHV